MKKPLNETIKQDYEKVDLTEAFMALDDITKDEPLERLSFSLLDPDDIDALSDYLDAKDLLADEDQDDGLMFIDLEAEDEEDLKEPSEYLGQALLQCLRCHSIHTCNEEDLVVSEETMDAEDEDSKVYNIDVECPYCHKLEGFKKIGYVGSKEVDVEPEESAKDDAEDNGITPDEDSVAADFEHEDAEEVVEESVETPIEEAITEEVETVEESLEEAKEDACPKCGKSPCECDGHCDNKVDESIDNEEDQTSLEEDKQPESKQTITLEDIDETKFDELANSYLTEVYKNVESFKTTLGSVNHKDNTLVLEGVLAFKSGKEQNTKFVFEADTITKRGKAKFIGLNETFTTAKKAFVLQGLLVEGKLLPDSLQYNYYAKAINESKQIHGSAKIKLTENTEVKAEEQLTEAGKDLSTVEHSMTKILQDNTDKFMNVSKIDELHGIVADLFKENKLDTPASNRLLDNIAKSKGIANALSCVYNSILKGSGLGVNEDCEDKKIDEVLVDMDDDDLVDALVDRLKYWTNDRETLDLYRQMYQNEIDSGMFEGAKINIMEIVDNDWVNWTWTVSSPEEAEEHNLDYEEMKKAWDEGEREVGNGHYMEARDGDTFLLREQVEDKDTKESHNKLTEALRKNEKLKEDLKIICDIGDYEPWSGARYAYDMIEEAGKLDELESYLEDIYPDGLTMTELNDILWFDGDSVLADLGIANEEDEEELDENKESAIDKITDEQDKHIADNRKPKGERVNNKEYNDGAVDGLIKAQQIVNKEIDEDLEDNKDATELKATESYENKKAEEEEEARWMASLDPEMEAVNEDLTDIDLEEICGELADECNKVFEDANISADDVIFDDSRAWSLFIYGSKLGLDVNKFGAYRDYLGGGVRGPIENNGREVDGTAELGRLFADKLKEIENLINSDAEDEEEWDKPTGVLTDSLEESFEEATIKTSDDGEIKVKLNAEEIEVKEEDGKIKIEVETSDDEPVVSDFEVENELAGEFEPAEDAPIEDAPTIASIDMNGEIRPMDDDEPIADDEAVNDALEQGFDRVHKEEENK